MAHYVSIEHLNGLTWQQPKAASGYTRLLSAHRRPYRTKDGWMAVMPYNEKQWHVFFVAAQREDVLADPRFADAASRAQHVEALYQAVAETMPTRTSAEWTEILTRFDIPFGPVMSLEDLVADGHMNDVGFWHEAEHPTEGGLRIPAFPIRDGGPTGDATPVTGAPALGEHTRALMRAVGFDDAAIESLAQDGVVVAR
jgi:crotonobetainyl-CoA:carnitine CoA-transferase CaiB-like acyl-CoA transferase